MQAINLHLQFSQKNNYTHYDLGTYIFQMGKLKTSDKARTNTHIYGLLFPDYFH